MKKTKLIYWISTSLFAAFMAFTAIPDILLKDEAVSFIGHLGYPNYFIAFIGTAKLFGSVAILIPSFRRIKEWAYAGLFFDLIGAVYSLIAIEGLNIQMSFMILPFSLGIISYIYNLKYFNSSES